MKHQNNQDRMHIGCLNGTVLKELQIVYRKDRDSRKKLRELVRKEIDCAMNKYYSEEAEEEQSTPK